MSTITRRGALRASAAATLGGAFGFNILTDKAKAAEFELKYANQQPVTNPIYTRAKEATDKIRDETNGAVNIRIFPNNQLGNDSDMISQLRSGALDFLTTTGPLLENLVPTASAPSLGFLFKDYPTVWAALDGDLGIYLRGAFEKANLHAFEHIWDNGFRQITCSARPLTVPDDFKGLKIRVPISPVAVSLFKGLGAAPLSLPIKEAYSALQTRLADGQENPLVLIETWKFYEVQKYCTLSNHMWDGFWMVASGKTWQRLPKNVQDIISKNWNEAALKQRGDSEKLAANLQAVLEGHGMQFNKLDTAACQSALRKAGFYDEWKKKLGPDLWATIEKYSGSLS